MSELQAEKEGCNWHLDVSAAQFMGHIVSQGPPGLSLGPSMFMPVRASFYGLVPASHPSQKKQRSLNIVFSLKSHTLTSIKTAFFIIKQNIYISV